MAKTKIQKIGFTEGGFLIGRNPYLIVAIFSFLIYGNTILNNYNLDDELVTSVSRSNPHRLTSKGITAIPEIFSEPYYSDNQGYAYEYRPVVLTSFAIEHSMFGDNPHAGHFINVVLYSLLCMLLLSVLNLLLKDYSSMLPLLVTLLFAVFPMHTEVVASLKNRDEILALTGALGSLYFFISYIDRQKWFFLVIGMLSFVAAIMSKQTIISFVIIIPILLLLFREVSLIRITITSIILCAVIFPFIQNTLLYQRISIVGGAFVFVLFVHEIRYQTLFKRFKLSTRFNLTSNTASTVAKTSANPKPEMQFPLLGKWVFVAAVTGLMILAVLLLMLRSTFYMLPLAILIPSFIFSPPKASKYLLWMCAAIAIYLTFILNTDNVFNAFYLLYVYNYFIKNEIKIIDAINTILILLAYFITCNMEFIRQPMGVLLDELIADLIQNIILFLVIAGIIIKPNLKRIVRTIILSYAVVFMVFGFAKNWRNFIRDDFYDLLRTNPLIIFFIFYIPHRKKLIVLLVLFPLLVTVITKHSNPLNRSFVFEYNTKTEYQINKIQQNVRSYNYTSAIQNIGQSTSYRPIDYVESVVNSNSTLNEKLGTGILIIGKYLRLTLIPYPMSFYYGYKCIEKTDLTKPLPLLILMIVFALIILALWHTKKNPLLSAGLLIYFAAILPLANIILPVSGMLADRYLFIPSLGLCFLLSLVLLRLSKFPFKKAAITSFLSLPGILKYLALTILLLYSSLTIARNLQWKDSLTLMRHDIRHLDESAQAHNLLAIHLTKTALTEKSERVKKVLLEEAELNYEKAVKIYPDFFNANYDLGRIRMMLGKYQMAEPAFIKVIELDSTFTDPILQVGIIRTVIKDYQGALPYYSRYLKAVPGKLDALINLSFCYAQLGDFPKALIPMKQGAALYPQHIEPLINQCRIFMEMGQPDSVKYYLQRAEVIAPNHPDIIMLKDALAKRNFR